ncbi:MAG: hypothetical protein ACYTFG_00055 [Planctomycetota bacterium]|jgi:CYTH domain-containing protein
MSTGIEWERKFLIFPEIPLPEPDRELHLVQMGIEFEGRGEGEYSRVRAICANDSVDFFYTYKRLLEPGRYEETENRISRTDFLSTLVRHRTDQVPILKTRRCYDDSETGVTVELDEFLYPGPFYVAEVEHDGQDRDVILDAVRRCVPHHACNEVTEDLNYTNAALASRFWADGDRQPVIELLRFVTLLIDPLRPEHWQLYRQLVESFEEEGPGIDPHTKAHNDRIRKGQIEKLLWPLHTWFLGS